MNILNFFLNLNKKKSADTAKKRLHNNLKYIKKKQYSNNFCSHSLKLKEDLTKIIHKYIKDNSSILTIKLEQIKDNPTISELKIIIINKDKNNFCKNIKI